MIRLLRLIVTYVLVARGFLIATVGTGQGITRNRRNNGTTQRSITISITERRINCRAADVRCIIVRVADARTTVVGGVAHTGLAIRTARTETRLRRRRLAGVTRSSAEHTTKRAICAADESDKETGNYRKNDKLFINGHFRSPPRVGWCSKTFFRF